MAQRGDEMPDVGVRMEPDEVRPEHPSSRARRLGRVRKSSDDGNGTWRKNPMAASGRRFAQQGGTSIS